jgi:hypothetical protein
MVLPARKHDDDKRHTLPIRAAEELKLLEQELGGRQALVTALTFAPLGKDARYVLGLLGDPDNERRPLAEICRLGRILPGQLVDMLAKGTELRSRLLSTQIIARRAPKVVEEVMDRAATYEDICAACNGTGSATPDPTAEEANPEPVLCAVCQGHGRLRFDADPVCRAQALELAGLLGKGGGISIVNQQLQVGDRTTSVMGFERMQEAMDEILFGKAAVGHPEVVDAELAAGDNPGHTPDAPADAPDAEPR